MLHSGYLCRVGVICIINMMFMAPVVLLNSLHQNQNTGHASQISGAFGLVYIYTINGSLIVFLTNPTLKAIYKRFAF